MDDVTFRRFDMANSLETEAGIAALLEQASSAGEAAALAMAVGAVARARGMAATAERAGLSPAALGGMFGRRGNPRPDVPLRVADAPGLEVLVRPKRG